jgi:hypothetical protein
MTLASGMGAGESDDRRHALDGKLVSFAAQPPLR